MIAEGGAAAPKRAADREIDPRTRFLREIAARVPIERVSEVHLFSPMRQGGMETGVAVVAVAPDSEEGRHTVYTATYRLTLKGPERGKWEAAMVPEGEAPLLTVDEVVRGVQRRAGDDAGTERLSGAELAARSATQLNG
ncbi:MAG TPA: hypothetical protein VHM67_03745 [Gemmatimonadaceae bacterium]|nr:hypothetical protein [Gemmatimonadaceae bacterium]